MFHRDHVPAGRLPWNLIHLDEVGSTNDHVRTLLVEGTAELPLVVLADRQTAGRGRESRTWWSDSGSLTFSVALAPDAFGVSREKAPRVALASAVALVDAIEPAFLPEGGIGVRWPNDVEAGGKKLAGILPEWVETTKGGRLIVGVGVNLSTRLEHAPDAIRRMATSISDLSGRAAPSRLELLSPFLDRLRHVLRALGGDDPTLVDRWRTLDTLKGTAVRVDLGSRVISGLGGGITQDGGLRLLVPEPPAGEPREIVLHGGRVLREPV